MKTPLFYALTLVSFTSGANQSEIVLDGKLSEPVWQDATKYQTFYQVVPATLSEHKNKVEGRVYSDQKGMYIGMINYQPANQRQKQYNLQDAFMQADFNRFVVDFSGDGSGAYLFAVTLGGGIQDAVLTPQLATDYDWDGAWQSAFYESEQFWSIEAFIPWHAVSFRHKQDAHGYSQVGVSLQLYDLAKNYIYGSQQQTTGNSDFYLEMPKVEVKIPQSQQWAFVPYASYSNNLVANDGEANLGFDLVYKPNHHQKLSVAVNPDFGQVDSDEVVLNYSAVETLRTDKRPFFTQDISVFSIPSERNTKLIHTRRIGAGSDDNSELITPIDVAARFVHQGENLQLAGFAVAEDNLASDAGKDFYAGRINYTEQTAANNWQTGMLATKTKRPWLARDAYTYAWDSQYQSDTWSGQMALMRTDVTEASSSEQGIGVSLNAKYQFSINTSLSASYLRLDDAFDNNDLGYSERNNWRTSEIKFSHAINTQNNWFNRILQRASFNYHSDDNGLKLTSNPRYLVNFNLENGGQFETVVNYFAGAWHDNLGYGTDAVYVEDNWTTRFMYISPYTGVFSWAASYQNDQEGLNGRADQYAIDLTLMPHPNWRIVFNNYFRTGDGWLVANQQNLITEYDRDYYANYIKISGLVMENLEFSSTFQWANLKAKSKGVFRVSNGDLVSQNLDTSFDDSRFNLQLKLRYKMGAYSDVFLVYGRGGTEFIERDLTQNRFATLENSWQQPDQEFVTFKVRYLF